MNKPLYILVGKSASGKTSLANILEKEHGLMQLQSYTTRPKRYENEVGHTFISDAEFDKLEHIVAYTEYNGYRYGATKEQVDSIDVYVLDVPGVETLLKEYDTNRTMIIFYFDATVYTRIKRMIERGDHDNAIISRLLEDEKDDWLRQLEDMPDCGTNNVSLYIIDANKEIDKVAKSISWHID